MDLIYAALSAAFVLSAADYVRNLGWIRMPVAVCSATVSLALLGVPMDWSAAPPALAAAFAALSAIVAVERMTVLPSMMRRAR